GRAGPHRFVEEHELLDGGEPLAAVLPRPAHAGPAVLAHLLPDAAHERPDAAGVGELLLDLGGEELGVVVAQLPTEPLLLLGVADVHAVPLEAKQLKHVIVRPPALPVALGSGPSLSWMRTIDGAPLSDTELARLHAHWRAA